MDCLTSEYFLFHRNERCRNSIAMLNATMLDQLQGPIAKQRPTVTMVVDIYWVMLLMGWAIAIWAIGVITTLYCCRSGSGSTVRDAPAQSDIHPSPDSDDSHGGAMTRRKQFPFETIYVAKPQRVFHTHACSACKGGHINDVEDMTELKRCKVCKTQLLE